jgi:hypothetical protein
MRVRDKCQELGREGWEMVSYTFELPYNMGRTFYVPVIIIMFKRAL